jgi:hypothetical protein
MLQPYRQLMAALQDPTKAIVATSKADALLENIGRIARCKRVNSATAL